MSFTNWEPRLSVPRIVRKLELRVGGPSTVRLPRALRVIDGELIRGRFHIWYETEMNKEDVTDPVTFAFCSSNKPIPPGFQYLFTFETRAGNTPSSTAQAFTWHLYAMISSEAKAESGEVIALPR